MGFHDHRLFLYLVALACSLACAESLNRTDFPPGFLFGTAASAYQYEGAAHEHGRGSSIWDVFTTVQSDKITDHSNGDIAVNFYYRFEDDIPMMKETGFDAFRFSISWSRVLPKGKLSGGVNQEGVAFYNDLIDEIIDEGLEPFVTLFHWDSPQALEEDYGGFLSPNIVDDFQDYADLCFKEFGDRVKYWITFNEPYTVANDGYATGTKAPGRCSNYIGNCTYGNSATEPYLVTHHMLLSHAAAVKFYREKYQDSQKGKISITLNAYWMVPKFETTASHKAAGRAIDFMFGWYAYPITFGEYPKSMRALVGNRLPKFSASQSKMLKGSFDFFAINYYSARYADDSSSTSRVNLSYTTDSHVNLTTEKDGIPIGQPTASDWLYVYPKGIRELLLYINRTFNSPSIYITENGISDYASLPIQVSLNDTWRLDYHRSHLQYLLNTIKEGIDVRAYFAWSFLDNFEWSDGYTLRFGITYVDYKNELRRYFKRSALWFKGFLQKENVTRGTSLLYAE